MNFGLTLEIGMRERKKIQVFPNNRNKSNIRSIQEAAKAKSKRLLRSNQNLNRLTGIHTYSIDNMSASSIVRMETEDPRMAQIVIHGGVIYLSGTYVQYDVFRFRK